jgi:hypothetical protein
MDAALEEAIRGIEGWLGRSLPLAYRRALRSIRDAVIGSHVALYPAADVVERNGTYETMVYCPGFLTIGDDSGGRAVIIPVDDDTCPIFLVDHGSMAPSDFKRLPWRLEPWIEARCPIE